MMRLVLSGGGDENETRLHHELFAAWVAGREPLLYVPGDAFPAEDSYRWICAAISPFGVTSIQMWAGPGD